MFFEYDITVPAQTLASAPTQTDLPLVWGIIDYVGVQIPLGVKALTFLQLWRGLYQIAPANPGGWIKGENIVVEWKEEFDLTQPPFFIAAKTYNDDDSYAHTLTVRVHVNEKAPMLWSTEMLSPQIVPIPKELM